MVTQCQVCCKLDSKNRDLSFHSSDSTDTPRINQNPLKEVSFSNLPELRNSQDKPVSRIIDLVTENIKKRINLAFDLINTEITTTYDKEDKKICIPGPSQKEINLMDTDIATSYDKEKKQICLPVPYYIPHTNGCPNAYATYGYAPCNAHMPVVKQPLPAVVAPNGYYYTNGFPVVSPGYPVPTGQLIEIESRNGYDMVDGVSTTSRVRRLRTNSNITHENDRGSRNEEPSKNGVGLREDEKQESEDDWGYVYRNLERQGYSKDLGERGDVLLSASDKQRRHSKETKKVKATNLDEAINSLTVNDRPLKMTEALERMEQRSAEKVSQPKERRHSQGSSYENVTFSEAAKTVKVPVKSAPSIGPQTKPMPKEKSEKEISKSTVNVEVKKPKDKEKVPPSKWECKSCTYLNDYAKDICEICSKSRNIGQERPMEVGGAECSKCTLVNPRSAKACQACNSSLKDSPTYI